MTLFACMCNQPERLPDAVAPVRSVLLVPPPIARWGLGYTQGGEALLMRTPRSSKTPLDLFATVGELRSDFLVGEVVADPRLAGPDNTPPFRFRRWLFAQRGGVDLEAAWPMVLEHIPDYLRRNLRGRSSAELTFHALLAMLHDTNSVDDPNVPLTTSRRALVAALAMVRGEATRAGIDAPPGDIVVGNGRTMIAACLTGPMYLRRLHVDDERGARDARFRGVMLVSGAAVPPSDGFEEIPVGNVVMVARDLRVDLAPLAG